MNRPVVVICPKSVINKWKKLLTEQGAKIEAVLNYEKLVRGNTKWLSYDPPPATFKDMPRFLLTRLHFSDNALVILDEAHKCKATNSLSAGIMIGCKKQGYKFLNLSATLAVDPREMKAIGYAHNLIRTPHSKDYKAFCIEHGAEWLGRWGALTFNGEDPEVQAKMSLLHQSLFHIQSCASRLTREDMSEYFPENHIDATAYTMNDLDAKKIQAVYDWLNEELERLYERTENYGACVLSVILEARQRIELLKVPLFCELMRDSYAEGNSPILFVNFSRTLELVYDKMSKAMPGLIGVIRGGQKANDRDKVIADFMEDKLRGLVANQSAGGVAIDLHDLIHGKYSRETFLSPSFNAREILQALGRIDRNGAKTACYQHFAYVASTIEEHAANNIQKKLSNLAILNDNDVSMGLRLTR